MIMRAPAQEEVPSEFGTGDPPPTLPPGFTFVRTLGGGGFGQVVAARMHAHDGLVAVKIADPTQRGAVAALLREVDALAAIKSNNTPQLLASGRMTGGEAWLSMSIVPGSAWPGTRSQDPGTVLGLFEHLLETLGTVHDAGFVHGDLKPENILVDEDETVSLIDFGLARAMRSLSEESTAAVVGTAQYMSPEQCTAGESLDARSDLYAVGILLYAAVAGAPPFSGSAEEIREAHRSRRPASLLPLGIPAPIDELISRCLSKDPVQRPQSTGELSTALSAARARSGPFVLCARAPAKTQASAVAEQAKDKQRVALLWFESEGAVVGLRKVIRDGGGQLAAARGRAYVAAYTPAECENPIRAAVSTGTVLLGRGLTERALVDVVEATVLRRPDGAERISSRVLRGEGRYLRAADDPTGLLATLDAASHLVEIEQHPHPHRADVFVLGRAIDPLDTSQAADASSVFFGRAMELSALAEHAVRSAKGIPGLATVLADRGLGKTRLARQLVERLMGVPHPGRLIALRVPDPSYGSRENTLRKLLTSVVSLPMAKPGDPATMLRDKLDTEVPPDVAQGLQLAMGWIDSDDPSIRRLKAAPGALRSMLAKALGEVLVSRARREPLRLIIDDAQFLDDATLDALEYATRKEIRTNLWVCVLARVGFEGNRAAWGAHAGVHQRMDLPPLSSQDAAALVRSLLDQAINVSEPVVHRLVERTKGVPLVILELIRALKRDGLLRRGERGHGWVIDSGALHGRSDVPLVQWLLARELDTLSPSLRAHAGLLAILGPTFTIERLANLVRELERAGQPPPSELDPAVGVHRLRRCGILVETANNRFEFRNDLLREGAYTTVPAHVRHESHRAAYRVIQDDPQLSAGERLTQLAFHAAGAGLHEQAVELELELARRAVDRHEYLVAHESFQRALDHLEADDPRRLDAIHGLGLMRFRMGRHQDALRDLQLASRWARELENPAIEREILLDAATVLDWAEDYPSSRDFVERAHASIEGSPGPLLHARILLGRGRSLFRLGDAAGATALLREAATVAESVGEAAYESRVIALLLAAPLAALTGQAIASRAMFDELFALCETHGDQLHTATTYLNRCVVWLAEGQVEELQADLGQAIEIARSAGFPLLEMRALFNLGEIAYMLGDYDEALRHTQASIDLVLQISGASQRVVVSRLLLARCHLVAGNDEKARNEVEEIQALQSVRRSEGALDMEFMPSDRALFLMVENSLTPCSDDQWDALVTEAARASMQQELVEVLELAGWAAEKEGRISRALSLYSRAADEAERHPTLLRARVARRRSLATAAS